MDVAIYDDCPDEFLKLFINLNEVTDNSGPLRYLQLADGEVPLIETFNTSIDYHKNGRRQVYPSSRIPSEVVDAELSRGGQIVNQQESRVVTLYVHQILFTRQVFQTQTQNQETYCFSLSDQVWSSILTT